MAGSLQSLIIVGLISAGGLTLRLLSLLGPASFAWALTFAVGIGTFAAASILLGIGIAIAMLSIL
ncbi:MAG: hypothetical protein KGQ82_09890 [Alphaproteobacteria bacterium]|nr:hypothetical protein [Alphaproteobacteria bacterium]